MRKDYAVITCLECKKRQLLTGIQGFQIGTKVVRDGCRCGSKEVVVTLLNSYSSAVKLAETPMPEVFITLHRILRNKVAQLSLITDMVGHCEKEATNAELANEPQRIHNIIKWLRAISLPNLGDLNESTETPEGSGEDQKQQTDRAEGSSGNVDEGGGGSLWR